MKVRVKREIIEEISVPDHFFCDESLRGTLATKVFGATEKVRDALYDEYGVIPALRNLEYSYKSADLVMEVLQPYLTRLAFLEQAMVEITASENHATATHRATMAVSSCPIEVVEYLQDAEARKQEDAA